MNGLLRFRDFRSATYDSLIIIAVSLLILGSLKFMVFTALMVLIFLLLSSWLIVYFKLQSYFLMAMAILMPFSYEFPLTEDIKLLVPGEAMIIIAIFVLLWQVVLNPSLLKTLFGGESRWAMPLVFSFLISLAFSTMMMVSIKFTMICLAYLLIFFFWQRLLFKQYADLFPKLLLLFSLSQLIVLAYAVYQFAGYDFNTIAIKGIFRPFYKDHTIWGAANAFLCIFWLLNMLRANGYLWKALSFLFGIVFLGAVLLSYSRAAFLSLVFSAFIWLSFQFHVTIKHLLLIALAGFILALVYRQPILETLSLNRNLSHDASASYLERLESSGNISTDISNLERLNRWYSGLQMVQQRPITGFGPGTYQFQYIPFQSPQLMNRLTVKSYWHIPENSGGTAHSEYVLALSEMGILGFVALIVFLGRWIWIAFNNSKGHINRYNLLIAFTVLSTYLFHGAFNNFLNTDKFAFLFWGFVAWMAANYENTDQPEYEVRIENKG